VELRVTGYACILAFDVRVKKSATKEAMSAGVTIFSADIIYHLFDAFRTHIKKFRGVVKEIFPCIVTILPEYIIKTHNPICIGGKNRCKYVLIC
jgi:translation initiation factor 5B